MSSFLPSTLQSENEEEGFQPRSDGHVLQIETLNNRESYLFVFNFDQTVVNDIADIYIRSLLDSPIPKEVKNFYNGENWFEYKNKVLEWMWEEGVRTKEISKCVEEMEPTPGMIKLLKALVQIKTGSNATYQSPANVHLLIISDANDMFIKDFLKAQILSESISPVLNNETAFPFDIISNKAFVYSATTTCVYAHNQNNNELNGAQEETVLEGSDSTPLLITPYEDQSSCSMCPKNLCKGTALLKYIQEKGPFAQVFYTGDGNNDICPALELQQHDYVFIRKNYMMHEKLQQSSDDLGIVANVVLWEDAGEIQSTIFENVLLSKI